MRCRWLSILVVFASACGNEICVRHSDCVAGEVCTAGGACVIAPGDGGVAGGDGGDGSVADAPDAAIDAANDAAEVDASNGGP